MVLWKEIQAQNLLPDCIFFYLKYRTSNVKSPIIANILETAGNIAKSSTFQSWLVKGLLQGMIISFK